MTKKNEFIILFLSTFIITTLKEETVYIDQPVRHFMDKLASKSPEPGGGSVAALTGAMGAALVSMVSNLTLGKEKYKDVQTQIETLLKESEKLRTEMQDLIEKDTEAYGALSAVYKMPKNTDEEKAARTAKMQQALKEACQVPFEIGLKSLEVAKLAERAADMGNVAAVSDAGVAVLLAHACAQSAALNVKINVNSIKDETFNKTTWTRMQHVLTQVSALEKSVMATTYKKMG
ncbi:MAG TPA: cyclodeaminase/cyclohydrolase family protein [Nitrospirota bacterium]|nr:cyclodeaminase/cyclohydrolase family protein [Nitrospirota bacterium]